VAVDHRCGLGLDGDAAFAFHLEGVGVLGLVFFFGRGDVSQEGRKEGREGGRV